MAIPASRPMLQAAHNLQDTDCTRWPATQLLAYLNDGIIELVRMKPNAAMRQMTIALAAGTRQQLPADTTMLVRAVCNEGDERPITMLTSRDEMDAILPGWRRPQVLPPSKVVTHVIYDISETLYFTCVPANNGTGRILAVCGTLPPRIPPPASDLTTISAYQATVPVPDIYGPALADYITARALATDAAEVGAAERAAAHRALFEQAVLGMAQSEAAAGQQSAAAMPR